MVLKFGVLATAILGPAFAQSSSPADSSVSTAATTTHTVAVGADGLNFTPNQVYANVGDIVEYRFYPQNHSVARAAYAQPCIPFEDTGPNRVGFWSGFQPLALVLSNPPIFRLPINDTEPVFFYCSAPGACFDGMVGVINPNATWTFAAQLNYSQNATEEFSPFEYFPVETLNPTRSTIAPGAISSSASTLPFSPTAGSSPKKDLSSGGIVGIAIGAFIVLLLGGLLIYMCRRQKATGEILQHSPVPSQAVHSSYVPSSPGISEANYPNMQKANFVTRDVNDLWGGGQFNAPDAYWTPGTKIESYSPPTERMTTMQPMKNLRNQGFWNGQPSQGTSHWHTASGTNRLESLTPLYSETHRIETGHILRFSNPDQNRGPHEMPVSSPSATTPPIIPDPSPSQTVRVDTNGRES